MRNQFDPLAQLHHQNLHHPDPSHGNQQMQEGQLFHHHRPSKPTNLFGNGFSNTSGFSPDSVGEKRTNSDENVDCNLLQSSMKRVRLSRSPGEFRLQRDLKTLDQTQWGSSHVAANALNFSNTTWIHRSTGTRLTMVDSLRMCLFLPVTAMQASGQPTSDIVNPEEQYQHQLHSYHHDYRWRIMIQIPRMYPHTPPAVTQIDGLALDSIVINEKPPDAHHRPSAVMRRRNENDGASSVHSTQGVTSSGSLFFTETQLARSQSSRTSMASTETTHGSSPGHFMPGKTIEWNDWSPITGLGELLDFLLGAAASSLSTITATGVGTTTNRMMGTRNDFQMSMAVTTAKSYSSSSLSSVSSASSLSSWGNRNIAIHDRSFRGGNNTVAETMMADENATTSSEVSGAFFLSPNRFDMGYGKSHSITPGATPRTTNTTAWQQHMQGRGVEDDVGMDMS
mmetsp:Transcript_6603/g.16094  ORF Transcript_6603/g.16094 Transcript_6603/m.16094 type:complete len:452 (-) Transcript_6603:407-1762(-)